ncbi:transposase-like protein, partial [Colletotrichum sojae]
MLVGHIVNADLPFGIYGERYLAEVFRRFDPSLASQIPCNDTCTLAFFGQLDPELNDGDMLHRRMRCYGHILNLVGRAFLQGDDQEALEEESQRVDASEVSSSDLRLWRQRGPIGKLRNIVKFIRATPQRSEAFKVLAREPDDQSEWLLCEETATELQLTLSNDTRWNSTYLMISRAIIKKSQIHSYLMDLQLSEGDKCGIPPEDFLTTEDWRVLVELKNVVEPLYVQTMRCQGWGEKGSHGYLWEILTGMEFLMDKLEAWRAYFDEPTDQQITHGRRYLPHRARRGRRGGGPKGTTPSWPRSPQPNWEALPTHAREEQSTGESTVEARLGSLPDS